MKNPWWTQELKEVWRTKNIANKVQRKALRNWAGGGRATRGIHIRGEEAGIGATTLIKNTGKSNRRGCKVWRNIRVRGNRNCGNDPNKEL